MGGWAEAPSRLSFLYNTDFRYDAATLRWWIRHEIGLYPNH